MRDPVDKLKLASNTLLAAQTELAGDQTQLPPHEAFGLLSAARRNIDKVISYSMSESEIPPAPTNLPDAKEPKDNSHPVPPQNPQLPDGAKYDEAEGGVPEEQPSQRDDS